MKYTKEQAEDRFPNAIFKGDCWIGDGAEIGDRAVIRSNAEIGDGSVIGFDAKIGDGAIIGDNAEVGDNTIIGAGAEIGDGAIIGFYAIIGDGAVIGYRAVIRSNTEIGDYTIIGDGAIIGSNSVIAAERSQTFTATGLYEYRVAVWHCDKRGVIIKLGYHKRTIQEWLADFYNNAEEFPRGDPQTKLREMAFMAALIWAVDTWGENKNYILKFKKLFKDEK